MTTQNLLIRLAVDGAAQVQGALGGVGAGLSDLDGAARRVGAGLNTVGGAFAALGVGLSVGAITGWIKGAIDAADEIGKLAQKTGLAAEQVAGLQLAFADGDVADKFQETLSKLSAEAANGNKAFAAMGVTVTNSTGGLKSTRDLLGEVADKFAGYRDGAEKTVLVQKLFGESGADLIVLLNGGSESLSEFDKTAAALGLTLSTETVEAAGQFNDTLDLAGQTLSGVASKVAAQLLPTLNTLAGELMGAVTNSGLLTGVTNGLAFAFKGLYSVGVGVVETFRTLGTYLGGVGAAIGALVRGDFGQINGIIADMRRDISTSWSAAGASIQRVWNDTENTVVTAAAKINNALGKTAPIVRDLAKASAANKEALKAETEALRARIAAGQSANAAFDDEFKIIEAAREAVEGRIKSGREMLESIERETALMGLSNTEREQAIALFALEKAGVIAGTEAYDAYGAAKIREAISARGNKQTALDAIKAETEATAKAAADATAEWQKTADSINQSLTDALMRGFESGKDFAKNLRDTLTNMFKTMVLRPIISAVLAPITGGLSSAANAAGGGGGIGGLLSGASGLKNLLGGAGILGSSAAYGAAIGTTSIGVGSQAAMLAAQTSGFGAAGLGATATAAGGAGAGITAALASIGPVGWAAIAVGVLGLGGAFSRKLKDSGVQGSFGGERGFEGENFQFMKGGFFRSDEAKTNPLDEGVRKVLGDAFQGMRTEVGTFATALGLGTDQIAGFTSSIKLSLKGLSAEDADKKIKEALATANNELAQQVLGSFTTVSEQITKTIQMTSGFGDSLEIAYATISETITQTAYTASEFARDGELAIDTLKRLSGSLLVVNGTFDTLGYKLLETSLAGGDLASKLADAFGGLENLASATSTYDEAFYSEAERTATGTRQLTETLAKLGIALPNTGAEDALAQYRALVEAQDINTESGRAAYAALVTLSGGFAQLVASTEQLGQAATQAAEIQRRAAEEMVAAQRRAAEEMVAAQRRAAEEMLSSATGRTDAAFAALERAVGAQRKAIDIQLGAAQSLASEVSSIFDTLESSVADLYRSVDSAAQQSAAQARAFISQSLSGAIATGSLPDSKALQDAISAARGGMDDTQFATQFEADRARLVLAGELSQLKDIAGVQLTEAERQIKLLESQLKALDNTLQAVRDQVDVMRGIDTKVLTVAEAIAKLQTAVETEIRAQTFVLSGVFASLRAGTTGSVAAIEQIKAGAAGGAGVATDARSTVKTSTGLQDVFVSSGGALGLYSGANIDIFGKDGSRFTGAEAVSFVNTQLAANSAASVYARSLETGISAAALDALMNFAPGTSNAWARDNKLPEFSVGTNRVPRDMVAQIHQGEMIVPAAYNPATSGIGAANTERLERLVEGLTAEVQRLQSIVATGNRHAERTATVLDDSARGKQPLSTAA